MISLWLRIAVPIAAPVPMSMPPSPLTITKVMSSPSGSSPRRCRSWNISTSPASVAAPFWNRLWMYVDAVRRVRVARADDHRAAGLVQDDDVALDSLEELVEGGEDAAAGAGAVAGDDALRLRDELPRRWGLDLQPAASRRHGSTWTSPLVVSAFVSGGSPGRFGGFVGSPGITP